MPDRSGDTQEGGGMKAMELRHAAAAMGGCCDFGDCRFTRVVIDSREVRPGDLFFAIPGERFDGHDFVAAAFAAGAAGAVVRNGYVHFAPRARAASTPPMPRGLIH